MPVTIDHASRIPVGSRRFYTVRGEEIAVLNVDGTLYAIRNSCPHMGGPLGEGKVLRRPPKGEGFVSAFRDFTPGAGIGRPPAPVEDGPPTISCPLHGWEFDLADGTPRFPAKRGAKTYRVRVEDGLVELELPTGDTEIGDDATGDDATIPTCGSGGGCRSKACSAAARNVEPRPTTAARPATDESVPSTSPPR